MASILFVVTGARHWTLADGTEHPTGFWAEELVAPYEVFTAAGYDVAVATPGGVEPAVDAASLAAEAAGGEDKAEVLKSRLEHMTELRSPLALEDVELSQYDAVFYPGGHGPMEDLSGDEASARLLAEALRSGKPLALVCHAPAALLATEGDEGGSPFSGYRVTGFTNREEEQAGLADKAPWLLQDRLLALGCEFDEGKPWAENLVVDRNLHTGQNPASSGALAQQVVQALRG